MLAFTMTSSAKALKPPSIFAKPRESTTKIITWGMWLACICNFSKKQNKSVPNNLTKKTTFEEGPEHAAVSRFRQPVERSLRQVLPRFDGALFPPDCRRHRLVSRF